MTTRIHPPDPTPPHEPDEEQLPCGRLLSQVWADWEEGVTDTHLPDCLHCRQAVEELDQLESAVRHLRDDVQENITVDAASLTERVMDVVRLELRPGRPLPLGEPDENMWIMESVAARTLRAAAEQVPGVRAGSCRIPPEAAHSSRLTVALDIHVPLAATDLQYLAEEVRHRVRQAAEELLGVDLVGIDIRITDLVDEPDTSAKGHGR
ncbi:Asp23/Gls24 family envelope stress response protein [Streptomyces beijiangensis]|uniref:Asp23/Gls24 family envelope stress response protein n=1 Tax=Streptomyces beijiangensis TaxID=163361 RepID=A0A939FEP4_9ACTN|nr:Asp23/Gls24 family envelope stress response protein [Streptomyces beijiangensis]MBO0516027.1 Asp23/Gls24 family envelope stress response protein [Streptomyces beijiangensis]